MDEEVHRPNSSMTVAVDVEDFVSAAVGEGSSIDVMREVAVAVATTSKSFQEPRRARH